MVRRPGAAGSELGWEAVGWPTGGIAGLWAKAKAVAMERKGRIGDPGGKISSPR